ncbi:sporulation-delaying protein SdpB family protein [Streptomyces sp. NPDC001698]|uniref:sporulation-delaying protein SdpB family protein n=1 Tax=Streptomyces sp. NPDC001698 TaxID=3364601 RepID=UPI0036A22FF0
MGLVRFRREDGNAGQGGGPGGGMLTARLGEFATRIGSVSPWTNVYGVARTLLALGTLSTLAATGTDSLFLPAQGVPDYPKCDGASAIGIYCLVPGSSAGLELGRVISLAVLALVAIGWRPRLTALPHWWIAFSFQANVTAPDGGDQITAVIALLLLPLALTDRRRWHWQAPQAIAEADGRTTGMALIAWSASLVIRVQVAGLYLQSSVAKLSHTEWADGTSLFYWLRDAYFGAPGWIAPLTDAVTRTSLGVAALTWGPLVIEFAVMLGLFAKRSVRPYLLVAGLVLHAFIGLLMGLGSFALAMFGCLVLLLRPLDETFHFPDRLAGLWHDLTNGGRLTRAERTADDTDDEADRHPVAVARGISDPAKG